VKNVKNICVLVLAVFLLYLTQHVIFGSDQTRHGSYQAPLYDGGEVLITTDAATTATVIAEHLKKQETDFTIHIAGKSLVNQLSLIVKNAMAQDDYIHYIVSKFSHSASWTDVSDITVNIKVVYLETKEQTAFVETQVQAILKQMIKPGMNDIQKETAVHDFVVSNIAYDTSLVKHTAYDALVKGKTVCQGYALLTYRMLNDLGIKNRIVEGKVRGEAHVWNEVLLDGKWYHLDTTWDDPVPNVKGRVLYNYFNLTTAQLKKDHSWDETLYPAANTSFVSASTAISTLKELQSQVEAGFVNKKKTMSISYHPGNGNASDDIKSACVNRGKLGVKKMQYAVKKGVNGVVTISLFVQY
jgi:hypothetical protein